MKFTVTAETDVGIVKSTNQDSMCVKSANTTRGCLTMAIICDGMGGLSKGELASASVIRAFSNWFERELPNTYEKINLRDVAVKWVNIIKDMNVRMLEYGRKNNASLGTTFSGMLVMENEYVIVHVGDTRVYCIDNELKQLTSDHTVVAREIAMGRLTPEQAERDSRRNVLLQCVGASNTVEPDVIFGKVKEHSMYMLCSDGFRHVISEKEIIGALNYEVSLTREIMGKNSRQLIETVKRRNERDNISVILLKTES